jgi:hypothetical protein
MAAAANNFESEYSDRKILHLPGFQVSYGVLGRLFFLN